MWFFIFDSDTLNAVVSSDISIRQHKYRTCLSLDTVILDVPASGLGFPRPHRSWSKTLGSQNVLLQTVKQCFSRSHDGAHPTHSPCSGFRVKQYHGIYEVIY